MTSPPSVHYASRTDKGMRRASNQDSLQVRMCSDYEEWHRSGYLFVVADGMGGHAVGDLASRIAVDTLPHAYFKQEAVTAENRLRDAIVAANKAINDRARENPEFEGMGTTCSSLSLSQLGALVGHVGDSRVYRVRDGKIEQLTFDHSLQWEMIRLGRATPENVEMFHPRNVITRCLGPDPLVQIDIEGPFSVKAGDFFLLCSDGLTNHVTDSEIGQIVSSMPPAESSRLLINLANCRGGSDNSTVVVVGIDSYPVSPAETKTAEVTATPAPRPSGLWKIVLTVASVLCLVSGISLIVMNNMSAGVVLLVAAVLAWLISRRNSSGRWKDSSERPDSVAAPAPESVAESAAAPGSDSEDVSVKQEPAALDSSNSSRAAFLPTAPYRIIEAELSEPLLSHLAEVQSELVQAAKDSGWKVDFEELSNLSKQAIQAQQAKKLDRAIKARGKAIDLLMRELYQRSRAT